MAIKKNIEEEVVYLTDILRKLSLNSLKCAKICNNSGGDHLTGTYY